MRRRREKPAVLIAVVAVLALAQAPANAGQPAEDDRLHRAMEELVERPDGPPGVAAILRGPSGARFHSVGVGNLETGRAIRRTDHMRIASTSKAFSGAVALSLVQSGELELDDTIGELLPALAPKWSVVTLAQALRHTSGIPSYTTDPDFLAYFEDNIHGGATPIELLDYVADDDLVFTPDTQ